MGESLLGRKLPHNDVLFKPAAYSVPPPSNHWMSVRDSVLKSSESVNVPTEIEVRVASNKLWIPEELVGVSSMVGVPLFVMKMSHDVMSVPGSIVPVEPSVVIVPVTLYPFWRVG